MKIKPALKLSWISLIVILTIILTSCQEYSVFARIEPRIIVQMAGIDKDYDSRIYTFTVQYSMGQSSDESENKNSLKAISGEGANIYSAIRRVRSAVGKELFFSHNQMLILGESIFKGDITKVLREYLLYADKHSTVYVSGAHGKAEDLLTQTFEDESVTKNRLLSILEDSREIGLFPVYNIYEIFANSYSTSGSVFLPMLKIKETDVRAELKIQNTENAGTQKCDSTVPEPKIVPDGGYLLFCQTNKTCGDRTSHFLEEKYTSGIALVNNSGNNISFDFWYDEEFHSLELLKSKTKIRHYFDNTNNSEYERLVFQINFSANIDSSYSPEQKLEKLKEPAALVIQNRIQTSLEFIAGLGGDLIGLEDVVKHHDFSLWQRVTESGDNSIIWQDYLRNSEFVVNVELEIV
ncbi:MAG: Ger(x)C family spore germination C-terminal domain-containing protein [Oscillospiraceae bacterium]|nr:Ger(x)C family spore germination C-terminal domain-containing protein [Oscillospiraceae bacterium]